MLSHCSACLIARPGERSELLDRLAHDVGFGSVASTTNGDGTDRSGASSSVLFFLVDSRLDDTTMKRTLSALRDSAVRRVCFAPVVLFVEDLPFEAYLHHVHMGFDDVIIMPEKREMLIQRLENQLGEHLYFRTPTYLGPDRRRFDLMTAGHERRSTGSSDHEEISVLRSALTGVQILRTKQFITSHARAAS